MNTLQLFKRACLALITLNILTACGGGSSADPKPENVPVTPAVTSADIAASVVKGTLENARIEIQALNGSTLNYDSNSVTNAEGELFVAVTGMPGFGINTSIKVQVQAEESSRMLCDAKQCGDVSLAEFVSGEAIAGLTLTTLSVVNVPYGSQADGVADSSMQVNALTTLATQLVEQAISEGRNVATAELMALAKADMSALLLRAMGWQTNNTNVFELPVISADQLANFKQAQQCETNDDGEQQCSSPLVDEVTIKLSLLNAAFASFEEQTSLAASFSKQAELLTLALADDAQALAQFREQLFHAIAIHPLTEQLGLTANMILDLELPLFDEPQSGGPIVEKTTIDKLAGATITARNAISDAENAAKAFDGDLTTKWLDHNDWQGSPTEQDPSWIQVDFAEPQAVNGIFLTSANDAPERDPENFTVLASNDGESWHILTAVIGASFDERFERQGFSFSNALKYSSYRINITKNKNNDGLVQVSEIQFVGPVFTSVDHTKVTNYSVTARNSISDNESAEHALDGDPTTKWLDHNDWQGAPSEDDPSWLQVEFLEPVAVNQLAITSANDAPERDPENFALLASYDGETWYSLANWVGESFEERAQRRSFSLLNQLAYNFYRVEISKNKQNDGLMQVAEIELLGPELAGLNHGKTANATYSARYSISDTESATQAFDDDIATKWLDHNDWQGPPSQADPAWIQVDLTEPKAVNSLALTSANDAPERDPENFALLASSDGENWQNLASWVGESFTQRGERREFNLSNGLAYRFYRLAISKNANNDGLVQLAEVDLIGPQYVLQNLSALPGSVYSARYSISDAESADKAFDNDTQTKWLDHNEWQGPPSSEDPAWIQVDFATAQVVSSLAITSANDAPERDPENFQLLGSNDGGETWTLVAAWVGESFEQRLQRRSFDFTNGFAYTSYRLSISKNANNDGLVQIAEVELIGLVNE